MAKGEPVSRLKGHKYNSDLNQNSVSSMHLPKGMSELSSKIQISVSNTVDGVAGTWTALDCDMGKICMPFKGT